MPILSAAVMPSGHDDIDAVVYFVIINASTA